MKKEEIILDCGCRYKYKKLSAQTPHVLYFFKPCKRHLLKYQVKFIDLIGEIGEDCKSFYKIAFGEE